MSTETIALAARVAHASASSLAVLRSEGTRTTLLEVVWAVSEITENDDEVVACVLHMIGSGAVRPLETDS